MKYVLHSNYNVWYFMLSFWITADCKVYELDEIFSEVEGTSFQVTSPQSAQKATVKRCYEYNWSLHGSV